MIVMVNEAEKLKKEVADLREYIVELENEMEASEGEGNGEPFEEFENRPS